MTDRDILVEALNAIVPIWAQEKQSQTLLTQHPSYVRVLKPLAAAVERCAAFQAVDGWQLFSANAGAVLYSEMLALRVLYRADSELSPLDGALQPQSMPSRDH